MKYINVIILGLLVASFLMNIFQRIEISDLKERLGMKESTILTLSSTLEIERAKNKIRPRMIKSETLNIAEVIVETTVDRFAEDAIESELMFKLGEAVWEFAKTERMENPMGLTVRGRAFVRVVDKRGADNE